MPTLLSDPGSTFYLLLIGFVLVAGLMAANKRDRATFVALGVAAALLLLVFLIDRGFESPREEIVRRVEEMAQAADTRNAEGFSAHLADRVEFANATPPTTKTRAEVTTRLIELIRRFDVRVAVWDLSREYVKVIDANTIEVGFMAKGETKSDGKQFPAFMRATFVKQPDGQYKLTRFATFHPTNHNEPLSVPGVP